MRADRKKESHSRDRVGKMVAVLCLVLAQLGCGTHHLEQQGGYPIAHRPYAPEPVYSRVTLARPPEFLPASRVQVGDAKYFPTFRYQVRNITLAEASALLASTVKYHSYCAAALADQKITFEAIGTIDELGEKIEAQSGISVTIDHVNKEVRFLRREA